MIPPPRQQEPALPVRIWIGFLLTRLLILLVLAPRYSDTQVYFEYATRSVDLDQTPYADFTIEYPPAAYWMMALPRHLTTDNSSQPSTNAELRLNAYPSYAAAFRGLAFLLDIGSFALLTAIIRLRNPHVIRPSAWCYILIGPAIGHLVYDRLDIGLCFLFLAWAYCRTKARHSEHGSRWEALSYGFLGLSVPFKLIGLVAFPPVLLCDVLAASSSTTNRTATTAKVVAFVTAAVFPFVIHYPTAGLTTLDFLQFHGERGIQIESTYASLLLLLSGLGHTVQVQMAHGSADLVSSLTPALASASTYCVLLALSSLILYAWTRRNRLSPAFGTDTGILAILVTLLFSKVLSAQYFIFALPIALIPAADLLPARHLRYFTRTCLVLALITGLLVPYLWFNIDPITGVESTFGLVPELHPVSCTLLVVRNLLFALIVGACLYASTPRFQST